MKAFFKSIPVAVREFMKEKDFIYGAGVAFYTSFSLVPVIYILIEVLGFFFGQEKIETQIIEHFSESLGPDVAGKVASFVSRSGANGPSLISRIIGFLVLLFSASAIFYAIQDSINKMWQLPYKQKGRLTKTLLDRLVSLGILFGFGVLFLVSIVFETALMSIVSVVIDWFPKVDTVMVLATQYAISLVVNVVIFMVVFRVLPYARVQWKVCLSGSIFTAVMFLIGQQLAVYYLSTTSVTSTYGAASAVMFILVYVYISAQIFFLGAKFTQVYAEETDRKIEPSYGE